jgi:hypothetical protein
MRLGNERLGESHAQPGAFDEPLPAFLDPNRREAEVTWMPGRVRPAAAQYVARESGQSLIYRVPELNLLGAETKRHLKDARKIGDKYAKFRAYAVEGLPQQ